MSELPIITFSHLRWDFVYQRPQQLMSRLAQHHPILFVEEPVLDAGWTGWEVALPAPNVVVYKPHTANPSKGFTDDQLPQLQPLLDKLVSGLDRYLVWLYTPMALPLIETLHPAAVVYDCMDELSLFLGAPPELGEREARLLKIADLVFTGGASLFRSKCAIRPDTFCFPSSVDADHFRQAAHVSERLPVKEARDQIRISHPRLGFFGVIDERLDLPLLSAVADAHSDWQIVLVGPVVKIDPSVLPHRPNLHYLGQRNYRDLPSYLVGWDVCLLPFALNDATRFISPTKTLEYMAAERPVVSTPIVDVAEPYGDIVYIGSSPEAFCRACEEALSASPNERRKRLSKMREVISGTSWNGTVQAMEQLLLTVVKDDINEEVATSTRVPLAS